MFTQLVWKRLALLCTCLGFCLAVLFVTLPLLPRVQAQARTTRPFQVKVLVITMFAPEAAPWINDSKFPLPLQFTVPGADTTPANAFYHTPEQDELSCNAEGVCLAIIGVDKVNAATSMMAILRDPQFSFKGSYFLTAGTASTSPYNPNKSMTLGSPAWANWIVDWDQSFHLLPGTVPYPYGYIPPKKEYTDSTNIFHLNPTLVQLGYNTTVNVHLPLENTDPNADVAKERALYGQAARKSSIANCDTITGDDLWAGKQFSQEAQFITTSLTALEHGVGNNCTYEQEDTAVAGVLSRFPEVSGFDPSTKLLNCYLDLRAPSAFDQPYPGQSLQDFLQVSFRANTMATDNLHLVGLTMVKYLISHKPCL